MERSVFEATRIAASDDCKRYDTISVALHWTTALLVLALWLLSQAWPFWPRGASERHALQALHISLGLILACVLIARVVWRLGFGRQPTVSRSLAERGAQGVHLLFYGLLGAQAALGMLYGWASKEPVSLFGAVALPSPADFTPAQNHIFGTLHWWVGTTIVVLAALHGTAALFHHVVLRDDVLARMLPIRLRRRPRPA